MSVYKRGDNWYYYFRIQRVRYRKAVPEAANKYQAQVAEMKAREEVFNGKYGRKESTTTFKEFVEKTYLPWAKENKRSWRNDYSRAKSLLQFFGKQKLSEINRFLIEQFKKERRTSLNSRGKRRSAASVNRELELLSRIFTLAVDHGELDHNPFKGVRKLACDNLLIRYLTAEEERRLLAILTGERDYLRQIVLLAVNTGMRRGEILSLGWDQVDFSRDSIHLLRTKSGRSRHVPMNSIVREILAELKSSTRNSEFVFPNPKTGKPLTDIKKAFKKALKDAKITGFRFHDLRHTAGTRMADAGIPITAISEILGHADIRTTMRYAHATDEAKRRAVRALEDKSYESLSPNRPQEKRATG